MLAYFLCYRRVLVRVHWLLSASCVVVVTTRAVNFYLRFWFFLMFIFKIKSANTSDRIFAGTPIIKTFERDLLQTRVRVTSHSDEKRSDSHIGADNV